MNITKVLVILLAITLLAWGTEVMYLSQRNASAPERIKNNASQLRNRLLLEHQQRRRQIELEYEEKKHLATGETVFDRVYNTQEQSIIDMIIRVSQEALPAQWSCDVKVGEFTHFILLVYLPHNSQQATPDQVALYLRPILKYCNWCLSDVAVFDRTHKSYLFFDKTMLDKIKRNKEISPDLSYRATTLGKSFSRFNSVTIKCEKQESHLFLPMEIAGQNGIVTCYALFDTGASITTLSAEVISQTGYDILKDAPRRSFNTANGRMSCPIVKREVNVGGYRKQIEVAVNQRDQLNLLGMNFFKGMDYVVDFQNSAIYVWASTDTKSK